MSYKNKLVIDCLELFHQKREKIISHPRALFYYCRIATIFIFSTYLYKNQNGSICYPKNTEIWHQINVFALWWKIGKFVDKWLIDG